MRPVGQRQREVLGLWRSSDGGPRRCQELGGIPAHPEINEEVAMQPRHIMGSVGPAYQADALPSRRNRRTIYAERIRTLADPLLEVFNKPGPDLSCERRDSSTIAPQAFTLLNSSGATQRSIAMALRLQKEKKQPQQQLATAIRLAFGRHARKAELDTLHEHYRSRYRDRDLVPLL